MPTSLAIHWFRQDLRLVDNPALTQAAQAGQVLPIYILDETQAGDWRMGGASRVWLHHSLQALNTALGGKLSAYCGSPLDVLTDLIRRFPVQTVCWNRCYEPWCLARDQHIKTALRAQGIAVHSANGALLWEPWTVQKQDGTPYKVFTPFYRKGCLQAQAPRYPLPPPRHLDYRGDAQAACDIAQLGLLPAKRWATELLAGWHVGEQGGELRLQQFLNTGLLHYKMGRDHPAQAYVSRLSPHLHFGELSPNQVWHALRETEEDENSIHFCSELGWREFAYSQLYYHPDLPTVPLQHKFAAFPWVSNPEHLRAWQTGQTGIPMVDAGMRELWQTGYMHNRVRMIVSSFLVKNLRIAWQAGARWFWETLFDADLANNSASWQWVAGCGRDAAPYFRIFNPVTQGQKFDPEGVYIRRFVPEIAQLSNRHLFSPWTAPAAELKRAGVVLGRDYPQPIVDLQASRAAALAAFKAL